MAQAPGAPPKKTDKAGDDGGDAVPDENKFDEFMGADGALLAGTTGEYDKDDREADEVWAQIDAFMDDRRRVCPRPRPLLSSGRACSCFWDILVNFYLYVACCTYRHDACCPSVACRCAPESLRAKRDSSACTVAASRSMTCLSLRRAGSSGGEAEGGD